MKTEQRTIKVYIHVGKNDLTNELVLFNQDVSEFLDYIFIGTDDVIINIPVVDVNQDRIDALEKDAEKNRAEFSVKQAKIVEQIQSLRAIEYNEGN